MPYANINGANLYYEEYGSGPPLILTPGGRVDREGYALWAPSCLCIAA